jgi:hypothetical protein
VPLPETKLQSTGQAGPEVNRDLEVLSGRLNEAIRLLNEMEKTLGSLTGGSTGSPPPSGGGDTGGGSDSGVAARINPVTPTSVASGTTTAASASVDCSAVVPASATYAWIRTRIFGDNSSDNATIQVRKNSGDSWRDAGTINPTGAAQSADDSMFRWVGLEGQAFLAQVTGSLDTTNGDWDITVEGWS